MSKRKMRMLGMVLAGVLAIVPFLHGCAAGDEAAIDNGGQNAAQEQSQGGSDQQQSTGSQTEDVNYGQVMAVNGDEITVVLGEMKDAQDASGTKTFVAEEDEITFNKGDVVVVDESGAVVDAPEIQADDVVVMSGTGEGPDFRPTKIEVLDITENGIGADQAAAAKKGVE